MAERSKQPGKQKQAEIRKRRGAGSMKRYPAYKDSGIEWVGEVPRNWELDRLKTVCTFTYGDSLANEDRVEGDVPVYGSNGIVCYHDKAITHKPCIVIGRKGSYGKVNFSQTECFPIDTTYFVDDHSAKRSEEH